jgi:cyclopropane fatty-acyl-phospholipid synthase-like methyltransferase
MLLDALPSIQNNIRWIQMMLRSDEDASAHYELLDPLTMLRNPNDVQLINLGYWKEVSSDDPEGLWKATQALFRLTAETAELNSADQRVLDVGCGYGTNSVFCLTQYAPAHMVGLNICDLQVRRCREQAARMSLQDRLRFDTGSATAMPYPEKSFDKLVSVEAAFHFPPRSAFLREAMRVLRPGGLLGLADLVAVPPRSTAERLQLSLLRRCLQVPEQNVYGVEQYREELLRAGFVIESLVSIRDDSIAHYLRWLLKNKLRDLTKIDAAHMGGCFSFFWYPWDYIVVKARKPL